jgi:hypothetical protein
MARGKSSTGGGEAPAVNIAEMTKDQLLELAAEKNIDTVDDTMEIEEIIQVLIEADPSLSPAPPEGSDPASTEGKGAGSGEAPAGKITPAIDEYQIGTIRVIKGVESVKVSDDKWVPTIRENIEEGKPVTIISKKRAGKTIFAQTGKPIVFDENGRATASAVDGQYLESIVIDGAPEYTVEGNE